VYGAFLAALNQLHFRSIHRQVPDFTDLSKQRYFLSNAVHVFHPLGIPPMTAQKTGPIIQHKFIKQKITLPETPDAMGDYLSAHQRVLAMLQIPDLPEMASVFMTPWLVEKQILNRVQLQPGQLGAAFIPNLPQRVEGRCQR
jgi:hypothetical protein